MKYLKLDANERIAFKKTCRKLTDKFIIWNRFDN